MEKKKIYIFFTYPIEKIGGTQMYTAGKAKYLEKLGWKVFVFTADLQKEKSDIPSLTKYLKSGYGCRFLTIPPYRISQSEQEQCLSFLSKRLDLSDIEQCDIIIESHDDRLAYWAELLAERLGARHFFAVCNEFFYPRKGFLNKNYGDSLDYFYFKMQRNELIIYPTASQRLFNGYRNVTRQPFTKIPERLLMEMYPIQDVDFPKIEEISKLDWNICHIGRATKSYVPYVIEGVGKLARRHPDKKINFIMVGNVEEIAELIDTTFKNLPNVKLTLLGDTVPIPKILFSKVDVVCAISQTARFTADAGVLTICANTDVPEKTPGLLGYDTNNKVRGNPTFSYVEALENVLFKRIYDDKEYIFPELLPAEYYYDRFWEVVDNASKTKEYYTERLSQDRIRKWFSPFPFASIARGTKIILVGNTEMAADYRLQILHQQNCTIEISSEGVKKLDGEPYCQILATIDEHPENFDNSVVGFERLKQLDYDAIILTAYTADIDRLHEKILETVPQMADRIICNLEFLDVYYMKHKETLLFEE